MTETQVGHCKADETTVYVGRGSDGKHLHTASTGERGWLGNPYSIEDGWGREDSIEEFRDDFEHLIATDESFRRVVRELHGEVLGCWCQRLGEDGPACHAEVIAEWADKLAAREEGVPAQPLDEPEFDCPFCEEDVWLNGFDDATTVRGEGDHRDVRHCGVCETVVIRRV